MTRGPAMTPQLRATVRAVRGHARRCQQALVCERAMRRIGELVFADMWRQSAEWHSRRAFDLAEGRA